VSQTQDRTQRHGAALRGVAVSRAVVIVGAGLAAIAIAALPEEARESSARSALVVAGVAGSWWALRRSGTLTRSTPERFEAELRRPPFEHRELSRLRELDTVIRMAVSNAFGVEFMLKPRLRELAAWRLQRSRGMELGANASLDKELLGERLSGLTDAAAVRPDNHAPGVSLTEIQAAVTDLERL
jgi:hypothetical protein